MKVSNSTQIVHLVNTTPNEIFLNISGDSNIHRGIVLKPGRLSFCICEFQRRKRSSRSNHKLRIRLQPRPHDVMQNVKLTRTINHAREEEIYSVLVKTEVTSLFKLASTALGEIPDPENLFPYFYDDWIYPHYTNLKLQYWDCYIILSMTHFWNSMNSCDCDYQLMNTNSTIFTVLPVRDFPHDNCARYARLPNETYEEYRERVSSYSSLIPQRRNLHRLFR